MILLIDNYDSFSYNLYQLLGAVTPDIRVVRNDAITLSQIEDLHPQALVLSPGPGKPQDAGICEPAVRQFAGKLPILGVCLGHQAICEAFGATVCHAKQLMHGKVSDVQLQTDSPLFRTLPPVIPAARYHSLAVAPDTLPDCLHVTAQTVDGEVMAVEHTDYPIFGVQFHPESVMTPDGLTMIGNFLKEATTHD